MMRYFKHMAAAALVALAVAPSQAKAALSVYVGYADNLRPSGFFPTPWLGGANVVSQSPVNQTFDSGAIRIDNLGATSITVQNFSVHFPSNNSTYSIWNDLVIGAGQTGIFAQFNFNDSQFDTSDFGIFGGGPPSNLAPNQGGNNGIGGCSSVASLLTPAQQAACDAVIPVISFDVNGTTFHFSDTGHILDTGEYDFINGSSDGNESINWNEVGRAAVRGGTEVPEPATLALLGFGLAGLGAVSRRRKRV